MDDLPYAWLKDTLLVVAGAGCVLLIVPRSQYCDEMKVTRYG